MMFARRFGYWMVCVAWLALAGGLSGQGRPPGVIRFANNNAPAVDAPFFESNGVRPLAGSNYVAALYLAPPDSDAFDQASPAQRFAVGTNGGYWTSINVTSRVFLAGARVRVQVRFWDISQSPTNPSFTNAENQGAEIGVAEIPELTLNTDGSPTPLFGLQSASLIPTLTLSLGNPRIDYDPATTVGGSQFNTLCDVPVGPNRWFRLTSPSDALAVLNTDGSSIDTVMTAFRGSIVNLSSLQPLACNDDRAPARTSSAFSFTVATSQLYLICVAGKNGASGPVQLNSALGTRLEIRALPGFGVEVSWPSDRGSFVLETASSPSPSAAWTAVTEPPFVINQRNFVSIPTADAFRCFRLRALP